jgi:hypothetical protein
LDQGEEPKPSGDGSRVMTHGGGPAHSPRRRCAEPSQVSALVDSDRLKSIMRAAADFGYCSAATPARFSRDPHRRHASAANRPESQLQLERVEDLGRFPRWSDRSPRLPLHRYSAPSPSDGAGFDLFASAPRATQSSRTLEILDQGPMSKSRTGGAGVRSSHGGPRRCPALPFGQRRHRPDQLNGATVSSPVSQLESAC